MTLIRKCFEHEVADYLVKYLGMVNTNLELATFSCAFFLVVNDLVFYLMLMNGGIQLYNNVYKRGQNI